MRLASAPLIQRDYGKRAYGFLAATVRFFGVDRGTVRREREERRERPAPITVISPCGGRPGSDRVTDGRAFFLQIRGSSIRFVD